MPRTVTRLLKGREVWRELTPLVRKSRRTVAAVAYLGRGGSGLLPLKDGDALVVDMSLGAVRQGVTDPNEIAKLLDSGVQVFSRAHLHAKMVVVDGWLVAGSMNISTNSAQVLDEAAVLTNARGARSDALRTISKWCGEPVLPQQLAEAIREYRPPTFRAAIAPPRRRPKTRTLGRARLWLVTGLVYGDVPESEQEQADEAERLASKGFTRHRDTDTTRLSFSYRPGFYGAVRRNDWVIRLCDGDLLGPAQVRGKSNYSRGKGKRRYLVGLEYREARPATWPAFRRAFGIVTGSALSKAPRSRGFTDDELVDRVLSCWSRKTGQPLAKFFAKRRKSK